MSRWSNRAPAPAHLLSFAFSLLAAAAVFAPEPAMAQSFNCRYAHYADEAAICQDQALGRLDNQLTSVYNDAYRRLPPQEQRRLDQNEDAWVLQRRQCGADPNCIAQAYHRRMHELGSEMGAAGAQPRQHPQPSGFLPPPAFRPFGGGAPVAAAPALPPPLPPGFRPPPAEAIQRQETAAPQIERRQSTVTTEGRDTTAPQIERRQPSVATEDRGTTAPQIERRRPTVTTEDRDTAAPQIERRQSTVTTGERDTRAPQTERRQSIDTTERGIGAARGERPTEGSTEAPQHTTTATTESSSSPAQAGTMETEPATSRSSSHRSKRTAKGTGPAKPAGEGSSQSRQSKPASDSATSHSEHHEEAAVKPPPAPNPPPAPRPREETHPVAAKPTPAPPPFPREETHAVAAKPAPTPPASGSSSEPPAKPVIRWVDPPPSK
jgi:uncharacterized protein YecT (DUF1311 family)